MLEIGTRVYHKSKRANGIIIDIDNTKQRDKYKVKFFWAKYCDIPHGKWIKTSRPERKWMFASADQLIEYPFLTEGNSLGFMGKRSLDVLIRNVCEIRKTRRYDDIAINYGAGMPRFPKRLVVNGKLVYNKFTQCRILGEDLAPQVAERPPESEGWIAKPFMSLGGRNIYRIGERVFNPSTHYAQREFKKIREFRTHCFMWNDNPVPFIQEKKIDNRNQLCWNKKQGGRFWYPYQEGLTHNHELDLSLVDREIMTKMSVEALKKLKYDFGGLDFGMDVNGNFKIFEVNSRMGLREMSFFTYKQMFNKLRGINIDAYKAARWV
jgi:hypothetical protein